MTGPRHGGALRDQIARIYSADEELVCALEARVERARETPEAFAELVYRDETDQRPIKVARHQSVGMRFVLDHARSVNIWPISHTKTSTATILTLYMTGKYPEQRGAVVGATQAQSAKIVSVVGWYIRHNPLMRLVWGLRPGPTWTDTVLIVDREGAIKDPTLCAYGLDTKSILGSRIDWMVCDDLLNAENTHTKEAREWVQSKFFSTFLSRVERHERARVAVMNSAWHPEDLLHSLTALGWAQLRMSVDGSIYIKDDAKVAAGAAEAWDHDLIKPTGQTDPVFGEVVRVTPKNEWLWPEGFQETEASLRRNYPVDAERLRLFYSVCRDDASAWCKADWIELCKRKAYDKGFRSLTRERRQGNTFTGVDLAFGASDGSDDTALFTFELLPDGHRLILDIQVGKWDAVTVIDKVEEAFARYGSIVTVESNAGQKMLIDMLRKRSIGVPVKAYRTGAEKWSPAIGVQSIFTELASGAWLIPCDVDGRMIDAEGRPSLACHPMLQRWIDECLYFTPNSHTGDVLMAAWFAREQARKFGALAGVQALGTAPGGMRPSVGAAIMSR